MTLKDPLFRHRLHAVISKNNLHGLVRQRQTLEFRSYLVAEVRELEVVIAGDVRVAAVIQRDTKKVSPVSEIECEFFMKHGGCRQGSLSPNKHVRLLPMQGNGTIVAEMDIEQTLVLDQSEHSRKRRQRKETSRNQRLLLQVS